MSAMHWEARRRQTMVDRRMSRAKQQMTKDPSEPSAKPLAESNAPAQQPAVTECSHCKNKLQYSAKIDNRYSSIQYSQQW